MLLAVVAVVSLFVLVARHRSTLFQAAGGVALAGHLVVAVLVLPLVPYGWDIPRFDAAARRILQGGATAPISAVDSFATFQALVYAAFGADPTTLSVVNGLFGVLLPLPACDIARRLYPSLDSADGVLLAVLFLPLPFLFVSVPMRDASSTLSAVTLMALVVRAIDESSYWAGLAGLPLWGMLYLLREELAFLVVLGAAGAVLVHGVRTLTGRDPSLLSFSAVVLPVGVAGFLLFTGLFPVGALDARLQYRSVGGAAYLTFMQYGSWRDVLVAAPMRAIYFQFAPFPLHVDSPFDAMAFLSVPAVTVLVVAAYSSLRRVATNSAVAVFVLWVYFGGHDRLRGDRFELRNHDQTPDGVRVPPRNHERAHTRIVATFAPPADR